MRQAGVIGCLSIRGLCLVVELQRQLDIPWRLGTRNLSHRGSKTHVWRVELYVVKRIDEISSELQLEPLREQEVLMHTQVYVGVMWPSQTSKLWGAVSKRSNCRIGEIIIVSKPLEATHPP